MNHQEYKTAKAHLQQVAKDLKRKYPNDKPAIRQGINDTVDSLAKNFPAKFSSERVNMYREWLSSEAVKLHPKNR